MRRHLPFTTSFGIGKPTPAVEQFHAAKYVCENFKDSDADFSTFFLHETFALQFFPVLKSCVAGMNLEQVSGV